MNRIGLGWVRMLPPGVILGLGLLFGAGRWKYGPGTIGSLIGILWYALLFGSMGPVVGGLVMLLSAWIAIGLCDASARILGQKDPSSVILDECIAMPFCFIGFDGFFGEMPAWPYVLLGFVLFRVFDISKPLFIGRLDRIEGGIGIVADDVASALVTCLLLHVVHLQGWFDGWVGLN